MSSAFIAVFRSYQLQIFRTIWTVRLSLLDTRIPVINLRRFAGIESETEDTRRNWIVVVNHSTGPVAISVDSVTEVVQLQTNSMKEADEATESTVGNYISAVAQHGQHPLYLPDFSRLLSDALTC